MARNIKRIETLKKKLGLADLGCEKFEVTGSGKDDGIYIASGRYGRMNRYNSKGKKVYEKWPFWIYRAIGDYLAGIDNSHFGDGKIPGFDVDDIKVVHPAQAGMDAEGHVFDEIYTSEPFPMIAPSTDQIVEGLDARDERFTGEWSPL